jgi:hypothetical protein
VSAISGTVVTTGIKGIREDLTDVIYNISPTKTPFLQSAGRAKAKQTLHEWQIDSLANPDATNFRNEGNDATFATPAATTRLGNYCQISDKTCIVSGTVESVDKAGRDTEMAYQMAKRSAELKRDMETIAVGTNQAAVSTDPRKTGSMLAWIKTNSVKAGDGADPTYTTVPTGTRTDGTQRALTEVLLKTAIQTAWTSGAEPSDVFAGAFNKTVISTFGGNADKVVNLSGAKPGVIVAAMDVYVSDFGNLKVTADRFQRARDLFIFDFEYAAIAYLRGFKTYELAKTGDAEKRLLNVEWALKVGNEAAHAAVYDLTTA